MSSETDQTLDKEGIEAVFAGSPFLASLGLEVVKVDHAASELTLRMPMAPSMERRPGTGQFHGGPVAAFVDVAGDFALGMALGGGVPTINLRIDFLKPAVGDAVTGVARVRRQGRTVTVVDVDVTDEKGSLVAVGRGTYATLRG